MDSRRTRDTFRITPAYAGKSGSLLFSVSVSGDHPRLCGEKDAVQSGDPARLGSPPPMRGKAKHWQATQMHRRITPAYAGKSFGSRCGCRFEWDHPRLCGEKFRIFCVKFFNKGSPPPMRGKVSGISSRLYESRITPAYAGKRLYP